VQLDLVGGLHVSAIKEDLNSVNAYEKDSKNSQ
jgi:hypothetical protein